MTIEMLFPEVCNLFGDLSNIDYLQKCLPDAEVIRTPLTAEPCFVSQPVNLVYMGPMTERAQEKVIIKLMPHKEEIKRKIENGTVFLFTGNALEVLGTHILREDHSRVEALGIFDCYAKQKLMRRHNSTFKGTFDGMTILGFKTQFTMSYPQTKEQGFIRVEKGVGMHRFYPTEGLRQNHFYGTYLVGPLLIMNPQFTKRLLADMGAPADTPLAFAQEVQAAFDKRMQDFSH